MVQYVMRLIKTIILGSLLEFETLRQSQNEGNWCVSLVNEIHMILTKSYKNQHLFPIWPSPWLGKFVSYSTDWIYGEYNYSSIRFY